MNGSEQLQSMNTRGTHRRAAWADACTRPAFTAFGSTSSSLRLTGAGRRPLRRITVLDAAQTRLQSHMDQITAASPCPEGCGRYGHAISHLFSMSLDLRHLDAISVPPEPPRSPSQGHRCTDVKKSGPTSSLCSYIGYQYYTPNQKKLTRGAACYIS